MRPSANFATDAQPVSRATDATNGSEVAGPVLGSHAGIANQTARLAPVRGLRSLRSHAALG